MDGSRAHTGVRGTGQHPRSASGARLHARGPCTKSARTALLAHQECTVTATRSPNSSRTAARLPHRVGRVEVDVAHAPVARAPPELPRRRAQEGERRAGRPDIEVLAPQGDDERFLHEVVRGRGVRAEHAQVTPQRRPEAFGEPGKARRGSLVSGTRVDCT